MKYIAITAAALVVLSSCGKVAEENATPPTETEIITEETATGWDTPIVESTGTLSNSGEDLSAIEQQIDDMIDSIPVAKQAANRGNGYVEYASGAIEEALAAKITPILFFHASWCGTCRSADEQIAANRGEIPTDARIIKIDFDTSNDLQKLYGVRDRHTFVYLDLDGKVLKVVRGLETLGEILAERG